MTSNGQVQLIQKILNGTIIFESNLKGQFEFESNLDALQVSNTQKVDMFNKVITSFNKNASQLGPLQIDHMFAAAVDSAGTELEMHTSLHCMPQLSTRVHVKQCDADCHAGIVSCKKKCGNQRVGAPGGLATGGKVKCAKKFLI